MPSTQPIIFDPFSREAHEDPYAAYAVMRESDPVYHQPELDFWFVSRYDDVSAVVNDWQTFSVAHGEDIDDTAGLIAQPGNLVENDPPRHDVVRRVMQGHFTPKAIAARLSAIVEAEVAQVVSRVEDAGDGFGFDFGTEVAWRLPIAVMSAFLGIPAEHRAELAQLQDDMIMREPGVAVPPDRARDAAARGTEYFAAQLALRRAQPEEGLLAILVQAEREQAITAEEALGLAQSLFVAGIDTTASLLSNAIFLLATYRAQQDLIREDVGLVGRAVEEILRFESPIQNAKRTTTRETVVGGVEIPRGAVVVPLFGSANRDPRRFTDPDVFDVRREPQRTMAFGAGVHHCIGAPVARLEASALLRALAAELPPFELAAEPVRFPSHVLRGLASVPVRFR